MANNNKSSFDRFGDDLAALILRYLSLEDQLRLECVSKQIQSCGIQRRTNINVDYNLKLKLRVKKFSARGYFEPKNWSSIMKRSPNVRIVCIDDFGRREIQFIKAIQRFRTHWPHLREIDCTVGNMADKDINYLCKTFPQMISKIGLFMSTQIELLKPYFSSMTALRELSSIREIDDTFSGDQLVVKDLRRLTFEYRLDNQLTQDKLNRLKIFIDGNSHLKDLRLYIKLTDSTTILSLLSLIGRFENLEQLDFRFDFRNCYSIANSLVIIANSCRRLKSLKIELKADCLDTYMDTYNAMKLMKHLRRLDLRVFFINKNNYKFNDDLIDPTAYASLKPVNCWPQLTHLTFNLSHYDRQFFMDLDRNLPKLQYLYIDDRLGVIDDLCIEFISKLKSLITLRINTKNHESINQSEVDQLINGCLKLKLICINVIPFSLKNNNKFSLKENIIHQMRGQLLNDYL
ncbi:uncharacterized protein LOC128959735 [Oppia nitens]|uniref:uncharacterized protein LOC128959735 n=1 Tax=Oppia nitens TaxID=1686743 RepID=UPI0023DC8A0C|nr:uncharacterized protein LOC128959735 [Oppia nitens]